MTRRSVATAIAGLVVAAVLPLFTSTPTSSAIPITTDRLLPASPQAAPFVPVYLDIPSIGVTAAVTPVGTLMASSPFLGGRVVPTFDVPPDGSHVGWWNGGLLVGTPEMSILLGHTQIGGGYAAFNRLSEVHHADRVTVTGSTESARAEFSISHVVSGIPKNDPEALRRVLSENAHGAQLALITCGGPFDIDFRASTDNIVAFATLS